MQQFKIEVLPLRDDLIRYARSFLNDPDETEDIIQEVYIKLWNLRYELKKYKNIKALSVEITKNACLNRLKLHKRRNESLDIVTSASTEPGPHMELEQKDNIEHVMLIINRLPYTQQAILKMKHIEGLEVEEIAELTGSNAEAVRMNLSRARKKVKEMFFKL